MLGLSLPPSSCLYIEPVLSVQETAGDNPSAEAHPTDDSEVPAEIIPEDVLLRYFGLVDIASPPASPVGIHRERVEESLARGIPTNKEEFHALRASLFRLSKETTDSPVLATTYNDMALALNDLFYLHRTNKDSHDEAVTTLQHLGSLQQEKNHIQTSFNELSADILMDLQYEAIAAFVVQEVSTYTLTFTEAPSTVVAEPLLGAEKGSPEEIETDEVIAVGAAIQGDKAVVDSAIPETHVTDDIAQPLVGYMSTNLPSQFYRPQIEGFVFCDQAIMYSAKPDNVEQPLTSETPTNLAF
ncbi:hypothetical protein K7X08_032606 [Anisodus acutangulus]|uniref:Uncharacterized protein n=1 Tax=Anisodus acutangulus TaxID=402998 RepID=A0A9Q1MVT7_9SOLA|nr:hypothetical protein K7X08_032606 [Anisodus acutangulus]